MATASGSILGVVGVKISMKNLDQNDRFKITRAAYRKLLKECGAPESDQDGIPIPISTSDLQEDKENSSSLGMADARHFKKLCEIIIQDSMLIIQISKFAVLRMPLQALAVASFMEHSPPRLVCLGKTNLCSFEVGADTERVAFFAELSSTEESNQIMNAIEAHIATVSYSSDHQETPIPLEVAPPRVSPKPNHTLEEQQASQWLNLSPPIMTPPKTPSSLAENSEELFPKPGPKPTQILINDKPVHITTLASPVQTSPISGEMSDYETGNEQIPPKVGPKPSPILSRQQRITPSSNQTSPTQAPPALAPKPVQRFIYPQKSQVSPMATLSLSSTKPAPPSGQHKPNAKYFGFSEQLPPHVRDELKNRIIKSSQGSERPSLMHRQISQPNMTMVNTQKVPTRTPKRTSLPPTSAEFQLVSMPPTALLKSEPVLGSVQEGKAVPLSPEARDANVRVAIIDEKRIDANATVNTKGSHSLITGKKSLPTYDKYGYLIMNSPDLTLRERAKTPPQGVNQIESPNVAAGETDYGEYEILSPVPDANSKKRQSKIMEDLYEDEKRYISELQELQNALTAPGISSETLRVVQNLYEFHRLTFAPMLLAASKGSKKELATIFIENRTNFKKYEDLLVIRSRFLESSNMATLRDKFLIPLTQLQKYNMALSIIQDREGGDEDVLQEAKGVIHSTLVSADNHLLLESISGNPFTPDQCGFLIHKGTLNIKSKVLSRKDYLTILTETHLIFAEKSSSQKKNKYSGCMKMDTLTYESQNEASFTLKGVLHPVSEKTSKFVCTAQNIELAQSWIKDIEETRDKKASNATVSSQYGTLV